MNKMLTALLRKILESISPDVKKFIDKSVKEWYVKAKETPNPYDDIAVEVVAWILGVDLDD